MTTPPTTATPAARAPGLAEAAKDALSFLDPSYRRVAWLPAAIRDLHAALAAEEERARQATEDRRAARLALEDVERRLKQLRSMADAQCMDPPFRRAVIEELREDVDRLRAVRMTYLPEERPR